MAKGNLGNILQHFVAIKAAKHLFDNAATSWPSVAYFDLFAMQPWEKLDRVVAAGAAGQPRRDFMEQYMRLPGRCAKGDIVATAFVRAGIQKGSKAKNQYPNTATLLRAAFPTHAWIMYLHEIDKQKREELSEWATKQSPGKYSVSGDWHSASFTSIDLAKSPLLVMLDPYKIVSDDYEESNRKGYLSASDLHRIIGNGGLGLSTRLADSNTAAPPTLITAFSYSDWNPSTPDSVIRTVFDTKGWKIENIITKGSLIYGREAFHQAWVITNRLPNPLLGVPFQEEWRWWLKSR